MTQATISKKINKAAVEIKDLIKISKRKLLELEVMLGLSEIKRGKIEIFQNEEELLKKLK